MVAAMVAAYRSGRITPTQGYIELEDLDITGLASPRDITREQMTEAVNRVFSPYRLNVKEYVWTSVYEVGQRLTQRFDDLTADSPASATPSPTTGTPVSTTTFSPSPRAMNVAAARAATRRGSSITIFRPSSQAASSNATGTRVVLPAPGGASTSNRACRTRLARISGSNASIGNGASIREA